jgi:hypothetical protein
MTLLIWLVAGGLLGYGTYAVLTWWEYGDHVGSAPLDPRLDKFIPDWEVAERHETPVQAPSDQTWHAVRTVDLEDSWLIRLIFRVRQVFMRGRYRPYDGPRNVLDRALAMGWGLLAEVPGQVIVMGAVTRPWTANPVFRALPAGEFASFNEPGYAKIVWSIGAEPLGWNASSACTETRVTLTDPVSRRRFRLYWSLVAPGVRLIRHVLVRRARRAAERAAGVSPEAGDSSAGFGHRPQSPRRVSRSAG